MREEFTTAMHSEMLEGEETPKDVAIMGVFGAMRRHQSLKKALREYTEVTAKQFKDNVVRVIEFDSWEEFEGRYGHLLDA
ncbi:MAG: hypothetical protein IJ761_00190 [Bacteroidales bacterium]|nr:hypothetical protein [Bacteroidales bacterium]